MPSRRLYSARSPFNRRISRRPHIDRDSGLMVAGLNRYVDAEGATITSRQFTVPAYAAGPRTRRVRVRLTAPWRPRNAILGVPLPRNAVPDPSSDGHLAVIDRRSGCEYDFWQFRRSGRGYAASWANAINIASSGVYPRGYSARGSGFALLAGVVTAARAGARAGSTTPCCSRIPAPARAGRCIPPPRATGTFAAAAPSPRAPGFSSIRASTSLARAPGVRAHDRAGAPGVRRDRGGHGRHAGRASTPSTR